MSLITLRNAQYAIAGQALLDHASLQVQRGERIALIGRNGEGKTTLLRILSGQLQLDAGEIQIQSGCHVAELPQEVPETLTGRCYDIVASGYPNAAAEPHVVDKILSKFQLPADSDFKTLSGGIKRRVLLARAIISEPDVLLLDEPTNHLDMDAILWLETFLSSYRKSVIFITHDRRFLRQVATRIIELDRGMLTSWAGNYERYCQEKQHALATEQQHQAKFDKKLSQEEAWIRQGIKARRTRNEGRVRALKKLREQRAARRERLGQVKLSMQQAPNSARNVIKAEGISFGFSGKPIFRDLSLELQRGDKIGLVGPNGCGKTTLIRCLLGELEPDSGQVEHGENLQVTFFDQLRTQLDEQQSVRDNVGQGSDSVTINGQTRHIMSYLQDFLFSSDRANSLVKSLSGGERNRVLLAKLFTKPCNVLVLDEPTNDLDIETLELLEALLVEFNGTVILVSHDREFLDNIITSCLVYAGNAQFKEVIGDYSHHLAKLQPNQAAKKLPTKKKERLSPPEQRELSKLPAKIDKLENQQAELHEQMAAPEFYQQSQADIDSVVSQLEAIEQALEQAYQRWEVLENQRHSLE